MGLAANPKTPEMYAYFLEPEVPSLVGEKVMKTSHQIDQSFPQRGEQVL